MESSIDIGLCAGNYYDYADDELAIQKELELIEMLKPNEYFEDTEFPADGRSLYFDPYNPPKGSLLEDNIQWCSVARGEVIDCNEPTLFREHPITSSIIVPGALGNVYFVNALRVLSTQKGCLKRLIVSDTYASKGIYTLKFNKAGRWRYVHIDDRIPCRMSGRVNFTRNIHPNETFSMIIEKAYAKLHGCYESLAYGLIDTVIYDLTYGAHTRLVRSELLNNENITDTYWNIIEAGINKKQLLACGRFIPDPYGEHISDRKGITLSHLYHVVDYKLVTSEPTPELDRLTIGMVCIRILQKNTGRHEGRWTFGSKLWSDYPQISKALEHRTKEIQYARKLGPNPIPKPKGKKNKETTEELVGTLTSGSNEATNTEGGKDDEDADEVEDNYDDNNQDNIGDENDDLGLDYLVKAKPEIPQPYAKDLCWIQIEDFVEVFNRVLVVTDLKQTVSTFSTTRYLSKWVPGDFIHGSGGPPVIIKVKEPEPSVVVISTANEELELEIDVSSSVSQQVGDTIATNPGDAGDNNTILQDESSVQAGIIVVDTNSVQPSDDPHLQLHGKVVHSTTDPSVVFGKLLEEAKNSDNEVVVNSDVDEDAEDDDAPMFNESFTDNPMYPFSVSAPTTVCISLYQEDRRWSVGRLGEDPRDITSLLFSSRGSRLAACMKYDLCIGFLLVKLSGSKKRVTVFTDKKIRGGSDYNSFMNVTGTAVDLKPGRYAVIPYTHTKLSGPLEYVLCFSYNKEIIECELTDIVAERPIDMIESDDETDDIEAGIDENEDEVVREMILKLRRKQATVVIAPPSYLILQPWEYTEDLEELSVVGMYDEIGDLAKYVSALRGEIKRIQYIIKDVAENGFVIKKEEKKDDKKNKKSSKKGGNSSSKRLGSPGKSHKK